MASGRAKSSGRRTVLPWIVVASGSEPASETMVESSRQRSGRLRAIGPSTGSGDQPSWRFSLGTSPGVGRKPTIPLKAAGLRREPPVSEPVASGTMLVASTTPEPPDEPAALFEGSNGLPVAPYTALRVLAPAPHSGVLVLPAMIAPALRTQETMSWSSFGTKSR